MGESNEAFMSNVKMILRAAVAIASQEEISRDGGRYFSKVTSYLLLITSHNVTHYSYILL